MLNVPENELFSAYLDGELTAEEQMKMEELLDSSPSARQLMDELRALSATLQSLPVVPLEEDLSGRVLRAAERQVLSEPVRSDRMKDASNGDLAPRPRLLRRVFRGRALWWSGVAVAVALLFAFGDLKDRVAEPVGGDNEVALDSAISSPGGKVPEVWATEDSADSHVPTVAKAVVPDEEPAVKRTPVEALPVDKQADIEGTMVADSDKPVNDPVAVVKPEPTPATAPDGASEAAKQADRVLVVKCDVSEEAVDGQFLSKILAKRKIARLDRENTQTGKVQVEVELTPTQYQELVLHLRSRQEDFVAVSAPRSPGAARPRIPSAVGPSAKVSGTVRIGSATPGAGGETVGKKAPTVSASAAGAKSAQIKVKINGKDALVSEQTSGTVPRVAPGESEKKPVSKPSGVKRPVREEAKFRVRFELNVVGAAAGKPGRKTSDVPAKPADATPKSEK